MERNREIDIIRGVAISLMVLGHCIQYGNGILYSQPDYFFYNWAFKIIYSFHMPLFMLLSGYLFSFTVRKNSELVFFLKNRIMRIVLPIVSWQLIDYLVEAFKRFHNHELTTDLIVEYGTSIFQSFWFLWAIFYCSVAVYIIRRWLKDCILIYLIGFGLTFVVPDIVPNLQYYKFMYPFFVAGYYYVEHGYAKMDKAINQYKTIEIILLAYLVMLYFWSYDAYIYTSGYTLLWRDNPLKQLSIDLYRTIIGFIGSILVIYIVKWVIQTKIAKVYIFTCLEEIGKESLGIYIISGRLVGRLLIDNLECFKVNYFNNILQAVIILFISYIITVLIKNIKYLNFILLGGR